MPNLSIREWVQVETYGGILLASNDEFPPEDFCNRSLRKKISTFLSPTRKFLMLSVVSYSQGCPDSVTFRGDVKGLSDGTVCFK